MLFLGYSFFLYSIIKYSDYAQLFFGGKIYPKIIFIETNKTYRSEMDE